MKTSLNELQDIETYLLNEMKPDERLLFEARMLLQDELRKNTAWQKQAYQFIQRYSRKKLKAEIEAVHQQLFKKPEHQSFREYIAALFIKR